MMGGKEDLSLIRRLIPSPFVIAVIITAMTFVLVFFFEAHKPVTLRSIDSLGYWQKGFWELLEFSMQMVLILVLGHTIALSKPIDLLLGKVSSLAETNAQGAGIVALVAVLAGFINWGLCLVLGAVLARKMAEELEKKGVHYNYPLLAAAGYSGMAVWHGGFSGSAPLKVAEPNHFLIDQSGHIPISETLFSVLNISVSIAVILLIPLFFYFLSKMSKKQGVKVDEKKESRKKVVIPNGAEKLEIWKWPALIFGALVIVSASFSIFLDNGLAGINLNWINFLLFGLALLLHQNFLNFQSAASKALNGALGIIIQFPIYGGIMGLMKYSGLAAEFAYFFVAISTEHSFPVYTFFSAAIINFFVPSGGGQWAIQGPIIVEAAQNLGVSLPKSIMAMAYGDQITNMLQPFWALPLLGITGLKAKDILPYSGLLFLFLTVIFLLFLIFV